MVTFRDIFLNSTLKMSSGPPHQPPAWNHLQVPNYYPRHPPQHAHMSAGEPPPPAPTWHTPTTEPLKVTPPPPSHIFSLEQMLAGNERQYPKQGVDLSLTKTNQNGEVAMTTAPISLSVRDTNKINSLLEMGANNDVTPKRVSKVDSILERLNPEGAAQPVAPSVDENSSSSSLGNPSETGESRRKRKPFKTVKVTQVEISEEPRKVPERRRSSDDALSGETPVKVRRKASSESETIDNIAAMIKETAAGDVEQAEGEPVRPISDLTKTNDDVTTTKTNENYVEVENKLEEMFAGIEDTPKKDEETSKEAVTSTSGDVPKKQSAKTKRKPSKDAKKPKKPATPTKKPMKKRFDLPRDTDSGSNASSTNRNARGPFVQIRGPRDSPLSVAIVNTPTGEDEDKRTNRMKKYHDDSEYRQKVRTKLGTKGLHSSTLSHQYDAQTKDSTWVCAFCKKGPHSATIGMPPNGDLFGPYFITTQSPEYERRHSDDPFDKQFKSRKITKALEGKKRPKQRRSGSEDGHVGIISTQSSHFEVWAHEDCIVWSPGTYLIGARIVGLEEAVWNSCEVKCDLCQNKGANICCVRRGCIKVSHVGCARDNDWLLDDETYKTYCAEHKP